MIWKWTVRKPTFVKGGYQHWKMDKAITGNKERHEDLLLDCDGTGWDQIRNWVVATRVTKSFFLTVHALSRGQ